MEMNKGSIPRDLYTKFQSDTYLAENPIIIKKYQKRADMLLREIEII